MLHGVKRPGGTPYNVLYGNAPVADPGIQGRGPGLPPPPHLFLDQTEARRAEKNFLRPPPPPSLPPYLRVWMTGPPTYLKVLIRHCAPPGRGTFFRLQVYERVGISIVEVYQRLRKSVISVWKRPNRDAKF